MKQTDLTQDDVAALASQPSAAVRAATAEKLATAFAARGLSDQERRLAEDIFHVLAKDTETQVRAALAEGLENAHGVPHDVALSLANDVNTVALPIIRSSDVLTDSDLIAIIAANDSCKASAIADRNGVSTDVADALVKTGDEAVVTRLVANETASISDPSLHLALDTFTDSEDFRDALGARPRVPASISERVVSLIASNLQETLMSDKRLSDEVVTDLLMQAHERIVMSFSAESDDAQLWKLVHSLHQRGRLTPSIILRAACMGDIRFFEAAIACRAGVVIDNALKLIHDDGELGLAAINAHANLPEGFQAAVRAALSVSEELDLDGDPHDRERLARRTIERILTQCGDLGVNLDEVDLDYLIGKLDTLPGRAGPAG